MSGGGYGGISASVDVTVVDDDEPDLVVMPTSLTVEEGGNGHVQGEAGDTADGVGDGVGVERGHRGGDGESGVLELHRSQLQHVADGDGDGRAGL